MNSRKVFFVMAGGGHDTDRHYFDTIKTKRPISEIARFVDNATVDKLTTYSHGRPYAIWGAVPGPGNIRNWEAMEEGDYVMVYRNGKIILAAEIASKAQNPALAEHLWRRDENGKTWEYLYFMINEIEFDIGIEKLNGYFGYEPNYHPQGFMAIKQDKVDRALSTYGDLFSLLSILQKGYEPESVESKKGNNFEEFNKVVDQKITDAATEHTEMQWRLIRLGKKSSLDVWVPEGDKHRSWNGEVFRDLVLDQFHDIIDVPSYIKNIDTVWKLGHSIKSAFEIENSTSIYSGILRLSDLRALAPNSNYPLFIVAQKEKKTKVFQQLRRPTFANNYLRLDEHVKFLSYDVIRELDESTKLDTTSFDMQWITDRSESAT